MKKIIFILLIINFFALPSNSLEVFKKSSQAEVKSILKQHNKALSQHDIEKIKSFYDENYKSVDGFDLAQMEQMLKKTYSAYENLEYKFKINLVKVDEDWALVQISDKTIATVFPVETKELKKEKMGKLNGTSVYNVYLKKENDSWKIISDEILMEETTLKYGIANKIKMNLIAPMKVQNGKDYDVSLKMEKPKDIVALASISREEVVYPPSDYQEKYRKMPEFGELERVVKANNRNLDEYAIASVGFTKVSMNEEQTKARIEVLGIAYLMKRVGMDRTRNKNEVLVGNN